MKLVRGIIGAITIVMLVVVGAYCVGGFVAYFEWAQTPEQSERAPRWVRDLYPYLLIDDESQEVS